MFNRDLLQFAIMLTSFGFAGCGLTVPDIKEVWDVDIPPDASIPRPKITGTAQIEFEIKKRIYCDLKDAVQEAQKYDVKESDSLHGPQTIKQHGLIPRDWAAQIALSLQVDESVSLNPGLTLNHLLPNATKAFGVQNSVTSAQSFSLGLGGTVSSTATRIDKFNPYYSIKYLTKPNTIDTVCDPKNDPFVLASLPRATSSPLVIESDLGIKDWLIGAMYFNNALPSAGVPTQPASGASQPSGGQGQGGSGPKPDSISYEIKFIIVSNGNVTPTWKLIRVSANTGSSPFFGVGRTRTHDLIITMGPPTGKTAQEHFVNQFGAAVSGAARAANPAAF